MRELSCGGCILKFRVGGVLASYKVDSSTNETPALGELLEMPEVGGCIMVADAMHCQKETAAAIIDKGADYLLCAKDNQPMIYALVPHHP
jgi:predicted transposase YbfD/YdcC